MGLGVGSELEDNGTLQLVLDLFIYNFGWGENVTLFFLLLVLIIIMFYYSYH